MDCISDSAPVIIIWMRPQIDQVLIDDFCGSGYSHHVDDLKFASDGSLFISAGDSAPFDRQF